MLATNESGPFRHRFGTPRDLLIGVTLALTDGRLVKSGGTVVKNVAGYDLGRLDQRIVWAAWRRSWTRRSSWRRCRPRRRRCGCAASDPAAMAAARVGRSRPSQLEPVGLRRSRRRARPDTAATRDAAGPLRPEPRRRRRRRSSTLARRCVPGDDGRRRADGTKPALWREQLTLPWQGEVRRCAAAWPPARAGRRAGARCESCAGESARAGARRPRGRGCGAPAPRRRRGRAGRRRRPAAAVAAGRPRRAARGEPALKAQVDVWGGRVPWSQPLDALKRALDPAGILNAGRGPL